MTISISPNDALIVIDVQNDFCPGGALAVAEGDQLVPGIAELAKQFDTVVLSQDWHPAGHSSFASTHSQPAYSQIEMPYGSQTLWPDHCVQGTKGADFTDDLISSGVVDRANIVIRKGMNPQVDSYSAFFENDKVSSTGLAGYLKEKGVERVFLVGLAYDFCVAYTALDARRMGLEAVVVKDLCRAIDMPLSSGDTTVLVMEKEFTQQGVDVVYSENFYEHKSDPRAAGRRRHSTP